MNVLDLVEKLKHNERCFGLLSKEERECFEKVGVENCRCRWSNEWADTNRLIYYFDPFYTYQIKPDYQSEPEMEKCKIDPSPVSGHLIFKRKCETAAVYIYQALSDPDFIEFQDEYGDRVTIRPGRDHDQPALIPKYVVFAKRGSGA